MIFNSYNIQREPVNSKRRDDFKQFLFDVPYVLAKVVVIAALATLIVLGFKWIAETF